MFFVGCTAFLLFFLNDINDLLLHRRLLSLSFPAGVLLLTASVCALCVHSETPAPPVALLVLMWSLFALFFALEIFTLFFAIPAKASYSRPGTRRPVYTGGLYSLCRHPGVLWFFGVVFSLCGAAGLPVYAAAVFTLLDLLLVYFEDVAVFPVVLAGYDEYKLAVPFIIPNAASIRSCAAKPDIFRVSHRVRKGEQHEVL